MGVGIQAIAGNDYPATSIMPNGCAVCGAARRPMAGQPDEKEPFVDFGMVIEFEGNPYICYSCFTEARAALELLVPDTRLEDAYKARRRDGAYIAALNKQLDSARETIVGLQTANDVLREEIKALRRR